MRPSTMRPGQARWRDESGVALVTVMLVGFVMFSIAAVTFSLAVHNTHASSQNRQRIQSVAAAEAGINYAFSHIQQAAPAELACQLTGDLQAVQGGYEVEVIYYRADGSSMSCPITEAPERALIVSTGTAIGDRPARVLNAEVRLIPLEGTPLGPEAVFSDASPNVNSGLDISGSTANNADLYSNGNIVLNSGTLGGSAIAQGSVTMSSGSRVLRDVWAGGAVTMNGDARVERHVTSSTSSIGNANQSRIVGSARAGTTIDRPSPPHVGGLALQNSPSELPPERAFPEFSYDPGQWQGAGYTVTSFGGSGTTPCTNARTFILGLSGGDHLVRIQSTCTLSFGPSQTVNVLGNLAIVHDGDLTIGPSGVWNAVAGTYDLFLFLRYNAPQPCTTVAFNADSSVTLGGTGSLDVLIWSPCTVVFHASGYVFSGQVFAKKAEFNAGGSLIFRLMPIPGTLPRGFQIDIKYLIECPLGDPQC